MDLVRFSFNWITKIIFLQPTINVTVYGKIGHNVACVDVAKRSI